MNTPRRIELPWLRLRWVRMVMIAGGILAGLRPAVAPAAGAHHHGLGLRRSHARDDLLRPRRGRPQHRDRVRRPARPRLRRLLRHRRLHHRRPHLAAPALAVPAGPPDRDRGHHGHRRDPRCADPARARRLPRHRHARVRRDHPDRDPEHRVARRLGGHQGHPVATQPRARRGRDQQRRAVPDPAPRVARADAADRHPAQDAVPGLRRARRDPLLLAAADGPADRAGRRLPDQGEPGRPGVGGHPRGRGRRRADGRADVPLQAARVRARRCDRRSGRVHAGCRPGRLHQPEQLLDPPVDALRGRGDHRRRRQPLGCGLRWRPGGLPARALPRAERLAAADLRSRADADRQRASAGPAAATAYPTCDAGQGRDRASWKGRPSMSEVDTGDPQGAARGRRRHHPVRRCDGARPGELRHQAGRDPRPDRSQRRRQDHLLQRDDRRLPGDQR